MGDLRKPDDVAAAVRGVEVVIHVATATPTSENSLNRQLMDDVNVKGLRHVIDACKAEGVNKLVYTSSASGGGVGAGEALGSGAALGGCARLRECEVLCGWSVWNSVALAGAHMGLWLFVID